MYLITIWKVFKMTSKIIFHIYLQIKVKQRIKYKYEIRLCKYLFCVYYFQLSITKVYISISFFFLIQESQNFKQNYNYSSRNE